MAAKKKRSMRKRTGRLNIQPEAAEPEPQYVAVQRKQYHNAEYHMTPAHPQWRDYHFRHNMQPEILKKRAKDKGYFHMLMAAVGLQGANRRRIELEQEIFDRVSHYNDIALRMNEQLGRSIDQFVVPFTRPRTHLDEYNDIDAIVQFLSEYWDITADGKPVAEAVLRAQVENAYRTGRDMGEATFAGEYKGPGYGDGFTKQAQKLLREAQRAVKSGKLR